MSRNKPRSTANKIRLFRTRFSGLEHVYGSYAQASGGRAWQIKRPVTADVILAHLTGKRPYGVYLLTGETTRAMVADFDDDDAQPPLHFIAALAHYGLPCYLERSKRRGFHAWTFMEGDGVNAMKARAVFRRVLEEIQLPATEVFPKQDSIPVGSTSFGNFINAPLFGALVPKGRTVFLNVVDGSLRPYANQWDFLESVALVTEALLDEIIEVNDIPLGGQFHSGGGMSLGVFQPLPGALPPCARRMLQEGVSENQRVSCFRLAVQLRRIGLPPDITMAALQQWATKNHPRDGKRVITENEIKAQAAAAFLKHYHGSACEDSAVTPYCDDSCSLFRRRGNAPLPDDTSLQAQRSPS
ncbi:MAG: hypothetical protein IT365_04435 [Candidatus Hydrogenedentes bacterium]|nr:hypothetical protein [Candidatus Hydrogenedentota bacterium]